jgi:hypothetical protein
MTTGTGRPFLSMEARNLGAMPVYEVSLVNDYGIKHVPFAARA